jgi:hypothetical protein
MQEVGEGERKWKKNLAIADESKPHVGIALQPLWEAEKKKKKRRGEESMPL